MTRNIVEPAIVGSRGAREHLLIVAFLFVVVHGLFFIYGIINADSLLAGDRAGARLETIEYVYNYVPAELSGQISILESDTGLNSTVLSRIFESGPPGDYIVQGLLLSFGGRYLVVFFQLLLSFLSIICVYYFGVMISRSPAYSLAGAIIYMLLPGNLMIPHQLASESLFTPLIVGGFFMLFYYVEKQKYAWLLISGLLLLTAASFVRPQLSLYPFVLLVILAVGCRRYWKRHVALVLVICFLIPACWVLFTFSQKGNLNPGEKSQAPSVSVAFYKTIKRMSVADDFPFEPSAYPGRKMSFRQFAAEVVEHPVPFLKFKITEVLVLLVNPGTYSLVAHHFRLLEGAGDTAYWKELRDREGVAGMVLEILRRGPVLIAIMFTGTLVWSLFLVGTLVGGLAFLRERICTTTSKAILVSYLFYGLLIVLISSEVRWTHRNPVEFVMVILFIIGLQSLFQRPQFQRNK